MTKIKIKRSNMGFFTRIFNVMVRPTEFFNSIKNEKSVAKPFIYFLIIGVFVKGIWKVMFDMMKWSAAQPELFGLLGDNVYLTAWLFFAGIQIVMIFPVIAWMHMFAKLFKGKGTFADTFKTISYGMTPAAIFGFIPGVFSIWTIVLYIKGFKVLHGFSTGRAIAAYVVSVIPFLILGIFIALFIASVGGPLFT